MPIERLSSDKRSSPRGRPNGKVPKRGVSEGSLPSTDSGTAWLREIRANYDSIKLKKRNLRERFTRLNIRIDPNFIDKSKITGVCNVSTQESLEWLEQHDVSKKSIDLNQIKLQYNSLQAMLVENDDGNTCTLNSVKEFVKLKPKSVEFRDPDGKLPLHIAAEISPNPEILKIIEFLVKMYPLGARMFDNNNFLPLYYACKHTDPDADAIKILVHAYPGAIQVKCCLEYPIHTYTRSAHVSDLEVIRVLISHNRLGSASPMRSGGLISGSPRSLSPMVCNILLTHSFAGNMALFEILNHPGYCVDVEVLQFLLDLTPPSGLLSRGYSGISVIELIVRRLYEVVLASTERSPINALANALKPLNCSFDTPIAHLQLLNDGEFNQYSYSIFACARLYFDTVDKNEYALPEAIERVYAELKYLFRKGGLLLSYRQEEQLKNIGRPFTVSEVLNGASNDVSQVHILSLLRFANRDIWREIMLYL